MIPKIYVYLFDGFSDWEIAYVTPEINKSSAFELIFFSENGTEVTSMGGLKIAPTTSLDLVDVTDVSLLILPGGFAWEKGDFGKIADLTIALAQAGKKIASICAATTFVGQLGLLDKVKHTSNDLNYLKAIAPNYQGSENYENAFAISDANMITANGIAPIEFACEVFKSIGLYDAETIENWFQLFKNGIWKE